MTTTTRINRREFAAAAAAFSLMTARQISVSGARLGSIAPPWRFTSGVSLAGAEFGVGRADFSNANPGVHGKDYQYPERRTIEYFAAHGLALLRLPIRWERLQPRLNQPLDSAELARLRQTLKHAANCGAVAVVDLHNYGRYHLLLDGRPRAVVIDEAISGAQPVTRATFADFWRRLAKEVAGNATIVGLGLMNEPHDMGPSDWKGISQSAVDAIREVNQETHVVVAGDGWSNAHRFEHFNGPRAWVRDPANRVVYESHCYFDADASGKYARSFASELGDDPQLAGRGAKRLRVFTEWCKRNGVPGMIGEFGIPGDNPGWQGVLAGALEVIAQSGSASCYWAAGEWWNDYPLSIQPRDEMRQAAPQQQLLLDYLGPRAQSSNHSPAPAARRARGGPS